MSDKNARKGSAVEQALFYQLEEAKKQGRLGDSDVKLTYLAWKIEHIRVVISDSFYKLTGHDIESMMDGRRTYLELHEKENRGELTEEEKERMHAADEKVKNVYYGMRGIEHAIGDMQSLLDDIAKAGKNGRWEDLRLEREDTRSMIERMLADALGPDVDVQVVDIDTLDIDDIN